MKSCRYFLWIGLCGLITVQNMISQIQQWPMINGNRERSSWASEENLLSPPLQLKHQHYIQTGLDDVNLEDLTVYKGLICISLGENGNHVAAVDAETGSLQWTFTIPGANGGMAFVCAQTDEYVFAGGQNGSGLFALNRETGVPVWEKPMSTLYGRNFIIDGELGYIIADSLYCLRLQDGSPVWTNELDKNTTPALDESFLYVTTGNKIRIFNKISGELIWQVYNSNRSYGPIGVDDQCFYTLSNDSALAFHKDTRSLKWSYKRSGATLERQSLNALAFTDSILYFCVKNNGGGNSELVALNISTGEMLWDHPFSGEGIYCPVIADGIVYVIPMSEWKLYGLDLHSGAIVFSSTEGNGYQCQPAIADHKLYTISGSHVMVYESTETGLDRSAMTPDRFELDQNVPNPFNPVTEIRYTLAENSRVQLSIYNNLGQEISRPVNAFQSAGFHFVFFNASSLPAGLYFCKLESDNKTMIRKMVLMK